MQAFRVGTSIHPCTTVDPMSTLLFSSRIYRFLDEMSCFFVIFENKFFFYKIYLFVSHEAILGTCFTRILCLVPGGLYSCLTCITPELIYIYIYILLLAPDFSRDSWFNEKFKLGLDFPNVSGSTVENYKANVECLLNIF